MEYWCYKKTRGELRDFEFLNAGAKQYLATCEPEVFIEWKERSTTYSDVSLANTLQNTIRKKFQNRTIGIDPDISANYSVFWMFQHRNDTSGKFLEFYKTAKQSNITDILLITQSPEFKTKFMFDGSTMTFESVNDEFDDFVDTLEPQKQITIYFLVLADLDLHVTSLEKNGKHFIQLHESDASRSMPVE